MDKATELPTLEAGTTYILEIIDADVTEAVYVGAAKNGWTYWRLPPSGRSYALRADRIIGVIYPPEEDEGGL